MYPLLHPYLLLVVVIFVTKIFEHDLNLVNIGMIHLLPILYTAMRFGRLNTLWVSLAAVISFDFLFIPPVLTFTAHDARYLISFAIMIIIGQLVAYLAIEASRAKELETSEKLQETLLGSLSHELRTPLAAILGASSGLLSHDLNLSGEQHDELLQTIETGAQRMRRLIDNLLDTARIQSGMLRLKLQECDIPDLLGSALAKAERSEPAFLAIRPDIPPIRGDAVLIELALFNLLENAFKYGDAVKVSARPSPGGVMIRICNTGSIPPSHEAPLAWKPFARLTNVRGEQGIGLGLYVAYRIAQMHGGTVETMSDGTQFCATMTLPERSPHE